MKCLSSAARAAVVVACLTGMAAPVFAQGADDTSDRVSVSAKVLYADLDLASAAGKTRFERRVRAAADRICGTDTRSLAELQDAHRCRAEVTQSGRHELAALTASHDVQVASRGAVSVASK